MQVILKSHANVFKVDPIHLHANGVISRRIFGGKMNLYKKLH